MTGCSPDGSGGILQPAPDTLCPQSVVALQQAWIPAGSDVGKEWFSSNPGGRFASVSIEKWPRCHNRDNGKVEQENDGEQGVSGTVPAFTVLLLFLPWLACPIEGAGRFPRRSSRTSSSIPGHQG